MRPAPMTPEGAAARGLPPRAKHPAKPATRTASPGRDLRIFEDWFRGDETPSRLKCEKHWKTSAFQYARLDSNQRPWD